MHLAVWLCLAWAASSPATPENPQSLAGAWRFRLDPGDAGLNEGWWRGALDQSLCLPGTLQAQGKGHNVSIDTQWTGQIVDRSWFTDPKYEKYRQPGHIKIPFWLQPDKHYVGAAWYQRDIDVPAAWKGQRLSLLLERPHWETRVWLDDKSIGRDDSLSTPHRYELGAGVAPGKHRLTVRVDNRMIVDVGQNAHSVSDHTQSNWNGVAGRIELAAGSPVWIDRMEVTPNLSRQCVQVKLWLGNATGQPGKGTLTLSATSRGAEISHAPAMKKLAVAWAAEGGEAELEYAMGEQAQTWDEFYPVYYLLAAELAGENGIADHAETCFGMREFAADGTQFTINGRKTFIRGTLECCVFPLTTTPPTDVASWRRILSICKSHGLNSIRFHSWCPPEAAFRAGDELGVYFQVECAAWAKIGEGQPIDRWLYDEGKRIVREYGNHPCFVMMTYGNEPSGKHQPYLKEWVKFWRQADPRRLHTSAAGWPAIDENQYHNIPAPRIQAWGAGLKSRINALPPETTTDYRQNVAKSPVPIVSHEIGQWCVYPNFAEMPKYTGPLKPKNFEIFRETLQAHHLGDLAPQFVLASGKLQALCYKEEIESALRTPGFGGFHLLQANDFPGQGTALVGWLDPFWEEKGYITAAEFRRFCGPTVVLARLPRRCFVEGETLEAVVDIAHFGPKPLRGVSLYWRLVDADGKAVQSGRLPAKDIDLGNAEGRGGTVAIKFEGLPAPARYRLLAGLASQSCENDWDLWLYPKQVAAEAKGDVLVTSALDETAQARLRAGGKVLLLAPPAQVDTPVQIGFSSVFWNTAWTRNQAPHTLGILCDPKQPVFAAFPTEFHTNWQWWELIHDSAAMVLDRLPAKLRPLVMPIDTWFENRRLGLFFECRVGTGRLAVCSIDLEHQLDKRPVARQFRRSLLDYLASDAFQPKVAVSVEQVQQLFKQP